MRGVVAIAVVAALAGCERTGAGRAKGGSLGPYAGQVPRHGVLVEECGLGSNGPTCVYAVLDADAHVLRYRPFQELGGKLEKTADVGAERAAQLFGLAKKVLETGKPAASDVSDLTLNLAISDDGTALHVQANGPFTDPDAKALVEAMIELAK